MCLMCIEVAKNRMKISEARVALKELVETATKASELDHYRQLSSLSDDELQSYAEEFSSASLKQG